MTNTKITDMTLDNTFPADGLVPVVSQSLGQNENFKQPLVARINSMVGASLADGNLGTFTGATIPDDSSVKGALQALEAGIEARPLSSVLAGDNGAGLIGYKSPRGGSVNLPVDDILTQTIYAMAHGVNAGNTAAVNATRLNALILQEAQASAQDGVYRTIELPIGLILLNPITLYDYVHLKGHGKDATILRFAGANGVAISAIGDGNTAPVDENSRRNNALSDFTIQCTGAGNTMTGIETAFVVRAFKFLDNIKIVGAGDAGLVIGQSSFDSGFQNVEILACGNNTASGTGLRRKPGATALAALVFDNLKIESCGAVTSQAGAIDWNNGATEGLSFNGNTRVQNNIGVNQISIAGVDTLVIPDLYLEMEIATSGNSNGIAVSGANCRSMIGMVRVGGSGTGKPIIADGGTITLLCYPTVNPNFDKDLHAVNGGLLMHAPPPKLYASRTQESSGGVIACMGEEGPTALFNANTGIVFGGTGVSSVSRQAAGRYQVTLERPIADAFAAGCSATAYDSGLDPTMAFCTVIRISNTVLEIRCYRPVNNIVGSVSGATCTITPAQLMLAFDLGDPGISRTGGGTAGAGFISLSANISR